MSIDWDDLEDEGYDHAMYLLDALGIWKSKLAGIYERLNNG